MTNHNNATRCNKHIECVQRCFHFQKGPSRCFNLPLHATARLYQIHSNTSNTFKHHSRYSSFEKSLLNSADSCFQLPELSKEATTRTMKMISTATSTAEVPQAMSDGGFAKSELPGVQAGEEKSCSVTALEVNRSCSEKEGNSETVGGNTSKEKYQYGNLMHSQL